MPPGDGAATFRARCVVCHGADLTMQQRLTRAGWERELDKMAGWGAQVEAHEREGLLEYLAANWGPPRPSAAAADGDAILTSRCLACHDTRLIEQQRLTAEGWSREVDKMIGWGAAVSPEEKTVLVAHLARLFPVRR